jgi:CheY-like chemotaxis protein
MIEQSDAADISSAGLRSATRAANMSRVQVLIVDDSADAAASLTMLLELEDITAQSVGDAEAALLFVEGTTPLLLLIDIGLPGMNGFELARRLRQLPQMKGATLIALTGREQPSADEQALFDQFWTKPFDPRRLIEEVKVVLNRAAGRPLA